MKPLIVFEEPVWHDGDICSSDFSWAGFAIELAKEFGGGVILAPRVDGGRSFLNAYNVPLNVSFCTPAKYRSFADFYLRLPLNFWKIRNAIYKAVRHCDIIIVRAPSQVSEEIRKAAALFRKPLFVMYAGDFLGAAEPLQKQGLLASVAKNVALVIDRNQRNLGLAAKGIVSIGKAVIDRYDLDKPKLIISDSSIRKSEVFSSLDMRHDHNRTSDLNLVRLASYLPNKDYELLFDVVRELQEQGWEGRLDCYGLIKDVGYYNALVRLAPSSVNLHGPVRAGSEVLHVLSNADVQVICSKSEGIPRTILEGAASGVALVTLDVGGISSVVVDMHNACIVSGDRSLSAQRLAAAILKLNVDRKLFSTLALHGLDLAKQSTRESVIGSIRQFVLDNR